MAVHGASTIYITYNLRARNKHFSVGDRQTERQTNNETNRETDRRPRNNNISIAIGEISLVSDIA